MRSKPNSAAGEKPSKTSSNVIKMTYVSHPIFYGSLIIGQYGSHINLISHHIVAIGKCSPLKYYCLVLCEKIDSENSAG